MKKRITSFGQGYQVLKEGSPSWVEVPKVEIGREISPHFDETGQVIIVSKEVSLSNLEWVSYGKKYSEIKQVADLIRGTWKETSYSLDSQVYTDLKFYLGQSNHSSKTMKILEGQLEGILV